MTATACLRSPSTFFVWPTILSSSKDDVTRGETAKAVSCYMHETGASDEVACAYIGKLIDQNWKMINKENTLQFSTLWQMFHSNSSESCPHSFVPIPARRCSYCPNRWIKKSSQLSDDVILNILYNLEDEPRNWARIACVSTRFSSLIRTVCCKTKCSQAIPAVVADLLPSGASVSGPPGGWASLYKLAVCCPGLVHSGVLLENSDFRIESEIGPDEDYQENKLLQLTESEKIASPSCADHESSVSVSAREWSLYDDLLFDTSYDNHSENHYREKPNLKCPNFCYLRGGRFVGSFRSHFGVRYLEFEAASKGTNCSPVDLRGTACTFAIGRAAFTSRRSTWDLHSSFCLRRYFRCHDDGEPVVRAYVSSNSIGVPLCEVLSTLDEELEWLKSPKAYFP
ncbi:UNVERIFIED_CONTAM: Phytochrome A-associated F-box protein [Sesamum calycinum]|uniref:Phytochrome A-associated F-box protein n=1 Tax=Sesamum calycinum TaxID=2727403 RepID=A0AAW2SEX5_9LAMI